MSCHRSTVLCRLTTVFFMIMYSKYPVIGVHPSCCGRHNNPYTCPGSQQEPRSSQGQPSLEGDLAKHQQRLCVGPLPSEGKGSLSTCSTEALIQKNTEYLLLQRRNPQKGNHIIRLGILEQHLKTFLSAAYKAHLSSRHI